MTKYKIIPASGYLLAKPYIEKDSVFLPAKATDGLDQTSEILAVGESVIDSNGIERKAPCKVGDIVHHAYSNKEVEIKFDKFRYIHFTEVHGVINYAK